MTDIRAEGAAAKAAGRLDSVLGEGAGDLRGQVGGRVEQARGTVLEYFGRAVDAVEGQVDRAPESLRPAARQAVAFSRERPFVTMLGLAAAALVLTRGARRR